MITQRTRRLRPILAMAATALAATASIDQAQAWTYKTLYTFSGGADGSGPWDVLPLLDESTGDIYGTTGLGGEKCQGQKDGCGVVFKISKDGVETVLHTFSGKDDGYAPVGGVIRDEAGNLYGTVTKGSDDYGKIFKLAPDGTFSVLHRFTDFAEGANPAGLLRDSVSGDLYGVARYGGLETYNGIVYRLAADGTFTLLHAFANNEGISPNPLFRDSSGTIFGTTALGGDPKCNCGTVYKITADGSFSVLHTFVQKNTGSPSGSLAMDKAGNLFGAAQGRGKKWKGSIFKLTPDGNFKYLHRFNSPGNGSVPQGALVMAGSGKLYGTTYWNDDARNSGIFSLSRDNDEGLIYRINVTDVVSGAGLVEDTNGNLYGATMRSGQGDLGSVFELVKRH